MLEQIKSEKIPNGPFIAVMLATGIGCFTLGLLTILVEASPDFVKTGLNFYDPVGPLSGVSGMAVIAYFVSWGVLHGALKNRDIQGRVWVNSAIGLLVLSILMTFPTFYQLFTGR